MNTGVSRPAALTDEFPEAHQHSTALVQQARLLVIRAQEATVQSFDLCVESRYLCDDRKYTPARDQTTIPASAA